MPGPIDTSTTLTVAPGTTELVRIGRGFLNQIITPFANPKLLTVNPIEVKQEGTSLYVATSSTQPVGVHILSNDPDDARSISLTLIPSRIPPRTITLQWPQGTRSVATPLSDTAAQHWEESDTYESQLFELLQLTARGRVPDGYALTDSPEQLPCVLPNVKFATGQKMTGHHFSVYVVRATNAGSAPLELLTHAGCNVSRVAAVGAWPLTYLEPKASTELYVIVSNDDQEGVRESVRPSLLGH